jgi:excinuclease ABC subunit C
MDDHLPDLREQARSLPEAPGVYFWRDAKGDVLYVGKAVDLRARVTSYFSTARRDRRTRDLIHRARSITCEVTVNELDALFRESALIKQLQPRFNRMLLTSRQPFYVKVDAAHPDPYLEVVREIEDDESLYLGPFLTGTVVRETVAFLHAILPLRKCTARNPRCKPCLYYQMHTCAAPLLDEEHRRQHQDALAQLGQLLDGRTDRVTAWLERKRDRLSASLLFEQAAEVQDRLDTLARMMRQQVVLEAAARSRQVLIRDEGRAGEEVRLLLVARGRVIGIRTAAELDEPGVVQWVRAHDAIVRGLPEEQSELDAASVLERWVRCNRERIQWVAVPRSGTDDDLADRVAYLLRSERVAAEAAS